MLPWCRVRTKCLRWAGALLGRARAVSGCAWLALGCGGLDEDMLRRERSLRFQDPAVVCSEPAEDFDPNADRCALHSDARWFNLPMKGYRGEKRLTFAREASNRTAARFEIAATEPRPGVVVMDKLMVELYGLYGAREAMPTFGNTRYFALSVLVPAEFEPSSTGERFIFWQLWQGSPYSPPVRLELGEGRVLRLGLRDDETGGGSVPRQGEGSDLLDVDADATAAGVQGLEPEVWHRIVIGVLPRHRGMGTRGVVEVWVDEFDPARPRLRVEAFVGYDPEGWAGYAPNARRPGQRRPLPRFDSSFGIYRSRQARPQALLFSEVTVADALPNLPWFQVDGADGSD